MNPREPVGTPMASGGSKTEKPATVEPPSKVGRKALVGLASLAVMLLLALFLPAGTLGYWQAWAYWLLFVVSVSAISSSTQRADLPPPIQPMRLMPLMIVLSWPWLGFILSSSGCSLPVGSSPILWV